MTGVTRAASIYVLVHALPLCLYTEIFHIFMLNYGNIWKWEEVKYDRYCSGEIEIIAG